MKLSKKLLHFYIGIFNKNKSNTNPAQILMANDQTMINPAKLCRFLTTQAGTETSDYRGL